MNEEEKLVYKLLCEKGELTQDEIAEKFHMGTEQAWDALGQLLTLGRVSMAIVNESDGARLPQLSDFRIKWIADIHREKFRNNPAYYFQG
jgi:transcription initiation factor IIE alpha subunit